MIKASQLIKIKYKTIKKGVDSLHTLRQLSDVTGTSTEHSTANQRNPDQMSPANQRYRQSRICHSEKLQRTGAV